MNDDWTAGFQAGVEQAANGYAPQIAALQARIAELESELAQLKAQQAQPQSRPPKTSQNSSLPPSSDPPSAPKRRRKGASGRKRGAQKGHPGHARVMLQSDEVDVVVDHHPRQCADCQAVLSPDQPDVAPPIRHQIWELPPVKPIVTEHRRHTVECPGCHRPVTAPDTDVPKGGFGVRATATAAVLHGRWRLSLRETATVLDVVCGLPVSVGGVARMCRETSNALAKPDADIAEQVRAESVANVDETSWRQAGKRPWIWVMRGQTASLFRVLPRRNSESLKELLGPNWQGTVISDRFSAYKCLPVEKRQVCWAHLKRDFQSFADWGGVVGKWGKELLKIEQDVFQEWHRFRDGPIDRVALLEALKPTQDKMRKLLEEGLNHGTSEGFCRELLALWPALWAFAEREGVEPTNNGAEQDLRPAVLWRAGCFGAFSDWGNQFVERILSLSATCRRRRANLLGTVVDALAAWRATAVQTHPT